MKKPLVSVIMPVYNAGKYLTPAINSILNQTFQDFELILIDDASSDGSLEILEQYKRRYPFKIKVIEMKKNLNCGGDRCANEGLKIAKGTYIARMDADDIAHKQRLEKQVAYLEANEDVFLVGSNAHIIDRQGKVVGEKNEPSTHTEIFNSYFTFHPLIHPTCTMRKTFKNKKFFYKLDYKANNDYLTFYTLICNGAIFTNLPEKLLYYRIHGKNDTFKNVKQKFLNTLKIRVRMVSKYGYKPSVKALFIIMAQFLIAFLLPEKVLINLYMGISSRGILSKKRSIPSFKTIFLSIKQSAALVRIPLFAR